jgi:hypothetical protein
LQTAEDDGEWLSQPSSNLSHSEFVSFTANQVILATTH